MQVDTLGDDVTDTVGGRLTPLATECGADPDVTVQDLVTEAFLYGPITGGQRSLLHQALDLGLQFLDGSLRDGRPLVHLGAERLMELVESALPEEGVEPERLLDFLREVAQYSVAQSDPAYLAFPDTGNSFAGLLGDLVTACLNQNLIAVERSAPVGSYVEAQLILWLRGLVGYPTSSLRELRDLASLGGMWTSGGNMSNHVAIVAALHDRFPEMGQHGLQVLNRRPVVALAQGVEHFSYASACHALGLGRDALLWSAAHGDYISDPDALRRALDTAPEDVVPFMVVAVAGNCRTTGLDDISAIADVCDERGLWLHVDACHGGSLLFSRTLRGAVAGIEHADSVSLDPHKGLFTTYACSFLLVKDPEDLARFARYPAKVRDPECLDLGLITPFYGSRRFESLKLWLLIKHLGLDGLDRIMTARRATFLDLVDVIRSTGYFTLLHEPSFYRLAFVFLPPRLHSTLRAATTPDAQARARRLVDEFTLRFSEQLYRDGRVIFDQFSLQDLGDVLGLGTTHKYQVIGMAVGHPLVPDQLADRIRGVVGEVGASLATAMEDAIRGVTDAVLDASAVATASGPAGW